MIDIKFEALSEIEKKNWTLEKVSRFSFAQQSVYQLWDRFQFSAGLRDRFLRPW